MLVLEDAKNELYNFLINPADSLIELPVVALLCYEPDAQSKSSGIVIDFNLFYKQSKTNQNSLFLAHEMFHSYRRNLVNPNLIKSSNLLKEIDKLQDEGIANLLDKTIQSVVLNLKQQSYPLAVIDLYLSAYSDTPKKLHNLEQITTNYLNQEINKKEFNDKLANFFKFGGHPNSLFMTDIIKKAGYIRELKEQFYSPVDFIKVYNKSAKQEGVFAFGEKFIKYLDNVEQECNK